MLGNTHLKKLISLYIFDIKKSGHNPNEINTFVLSLFFCSTHGV